MPAATRSNRFASSLRQLASELVGMWPALPFLALGVWSAWSALTYSGSIWLSDNEVNGEWLSNMFTVSTLTFAVVFLTTAILAQKRRINPQVSSRTVIRGGVLASVGCLLIILAGPYYLSSIIGQVRPIFYLGAILSGIGTGFIGLRCGMLYGMLTPRKALINVALSQLTCAFIYFMVFALPDWAPVQHGPSLGDIIVFCALPLMAAGLSCFPVPTIASSNDDARSYDPDIHRLPPSFARFVAFSFLLSFIVAVIRSAVVTTHALATTIDGSNVLMLLRVAMGIAIVLYSVRSEAHGMNLGKLCSLLAVISAIAIAIAAALGGLSNIWSVVVYFAVALFEAFMWCLLAFVVAQKRVSPITVFGFGHGAFMLGLGLGWMVGSIVMPYVVTESYATVVYVVMAGVMLLLALGLFSERDFERLFSPADAGELTLHELFDIEAREEAEAEREHGEKRGRFSRAIKSISDQYGLSARESDALRCLAMGYGSERMAETMGVKVNTARAHTHNVYVKLGVHSREGLMVLVDEVVAKI